MTSLSSSISSSSPRIFMIIVSIYALVYGQTEDRVNDDVTCIMTFHNWLSPTGMTVNWTYPQHAPKQEDVDVNITWFISSSSTFGPCPEMGLTSCMWNYGPEMNFGANFQLRVQIVVKTTNLMVLDKEWEINPDDCRKPPPVDHVFLQIINSTCVNMTWWYEEVTKCSEFDEKYYRISYKKNDTLDVKVVNDRNTPLEKFCNTSRIVCDLQPYTSYVFNVQTKFPDWNSTIRGHYSDGTFSMLTTPEDVLSNIYIFYLKIDSTKLIRVHLRVQKSIKEYPGQPRDYLVGVSIIDSKSSVDEGDKIKKCKPTCFDSWTIETWVQRNTAINFKYFVIKAKTSALVDSEDVHIHRAFIGVKPVLIECTFNQEGVIIREAKRAGFDIRNTSKRTKIAQQMLRIPVPAGVPGIISGCYSEIQQKCSDENTRVVRIYWKDLSSDLKYGIITHFKMEIFINTTYSKTLVTSSLVPGSHYNHDEMLKCDSEYEIQIRAATSVGVSSLYSSLFIQRFNEGYQNMIQDIIPVISNNSFHVYWLKSLEVTIDRSRDLRVFWCYRDVTNRCKSPINWTNVSGDSPNGYFLDLHGSVSHRNRFGIGHELTGIKWWRCLYTHTHDSLAPVGLRLELHESSLAGSMKIYWDNLPCESQPHSPFINVFIVTICKIDIRNTCKDKEDEISVDGERNNFAFNDLDSRVTYMVCIQSQGISRDHRSQKSCIKGKPAGKDRIHSSVIVISVVGPVALVTVVCFVICVVEKMRKTFRRFPVTIPTFQDKYDDKKSSEEFPLNDKQSSSSNTTLMP